jgi:uncharacterized protein (TIGR02996 family)
MSHAAGFLLDIREHPDDDVPRLVYADWLDENGQPERAEFIRVQIELARAELADPRRPDLESRQLQLLARHRKEWAGPLRALVPQWEFRRGFVEAIKLPARTFLEHAEELFRLAPVRDVHLVGVSEHADELARCPHLRQLTALTLTDPRFTAGQRRSQRQRRWRNGEFTNPLGTDVLRTLLHSPYLREVRRLGLAHCFLGASGAAALAASPLAGLDALDVSNNDFNVEDVARLAEAPFLRRVRDLRIASCYNGNDYDYAEDPEETVDEPGAPPRFPHAVARFLDHVEVLDLGSCNLSAHDVIRLAAAQPAALTTLLLERNPLFPDGVRRLVQSSLLDRVCVLDMSSCYLTGRDVNSPRGGSLQILLESPKIAGLLRLGLRNNPLGIEGVRVLANSPHLAGLTRLELLGSTYREWYQEGAGEFAYRRGAPQDFIGDAGLTVQRYGGRFEDR